MSKIKDKDYCHLTNSKKTHDNKSGPCKCGAWHKQSDFEDSNSSSSIIGNSLMTGKYERQQRKPDRK